MAVTFILALLDLSIVIAFALVAIFLKALDGRGFLASLLVGYSILIGGGLSWFVMVAAFFTMGVGFTWYKYEYKKKLGSAQEKGGARNWPNILANGGLSSAFALAEFAYGGSVFAALFLGSISTAAADTVATELGLLNERKPRLITHLGSIVSPGTSGGVTILGFIGAILASVVMGAMALVLGLLPVGPVIILVCVAGGLSGAVVDSLLGALVQRKGFCTVCHRPTEALKHCGEPTIVTGGAPFIENNVVNLLATLAGALASLAAAFALAAA